MSCKGCSIKCIEFGGCVKGKVDIMEYGKKVGERVDGVRVYMIEEDMDVPSFLRNQML